MFDVVLEDLYSTDVELSVAKVNSNLDIMDLFSSHPALSKVCRLST